MLRVISYELFVNSMAVEIKKKEYETVGAMLRRFTRSVQQSGVLVRARKIRFKEAIKTKRERKISALYRNIKRKEEARLIRLGKKIEEPKKFGR